MKIIFKSITLFVLFYIIISSYSLFTESQNIQKDKSLNYYKDFTNGIRTLIHVEFPRDIYSITKSHNSNVEFSILSDKMGNKELVLDGNSIFEIGGKFDVNFATPYILTVELSSNKKLFPFVHLKAGFAQYDKNGELLSLSNEANKYFIETGLIKPSLFSNRKIKFSGVAWGQGDDLFEFSKNTVQISPVIYIWYENKISKVSLSEVTLKQIKP